MLYVFKRLKFTLQTPYWISPYDNIHTSVGRPNGLLLAFFEFLQRVRRDFTTDMSAETASEFLHADPNFCIHRKGFQSFWKFKNGVLLF